MTAMDEFLTRLDQPAMRAVYTDLDQTWNERAAMVNARLAAAQLPVRVANLSSIWTIVYTAPSRYNWIYQYYVRAQGLALSWIGTGRLIFSLNYSDADFAAVADRLIEAAAQMERDGWWWHDGAATNKSIRRSVLKEILAHRF
jgi:glutamate-1-semialdehyde 2,1-aminomutase